jgi:Ca2+-binding EF-hand superfamily protein
MMLYLYNYTVLDTAGDGRLDRDDLQGGLIAHGVDSLDDEQITALLNAFDRNGDGLIE